MALGETLLPEFDHEMAQTRITLERVPEDRFGWKPHDKSGTMGWLGEDHARAGFARPRAAGWRLAWPDSPGEDAKGAP